MSGATDFINWLILSFIILVVEHDLVNAMSSDVHATRSFVARIGSVGTSIPLLVSDAKCCVTALQCASAASMSIAWAPAKTMVWNSKMLSRLWDRQMKAVSFGTTQSFNSSQLSLFTARSVASRALKKCPYALTR